MQEIFFVSGILVKPSCSLELTEWAWESPRGGFPLGLRCVSHIYVVSSTIQEVHLLWYLFIYISESTEIMEMKA